MAEDQGPIPGERWVHSGARISVTILNRFGAQVIWRNEYGQHTGRDTLDSFLKRFERAPTVLEAAHRAETSNGQPTREELLRFVSEATGHAGSFAAQMGATMPWTGSRKARTQRVYEWGQRLLKEAGMEGRYE